MADENENTTEEQEQDTAPEETATDQAAQPEVSESEPAATEPEPEPAPAATTPLSTGDPAVVSPGVTEATTDDKGAVEAKTDDEDEDEDAQGEAEKASVVPEVPESTAPAPETATAQEDLRQYESSLAARQRESAEAMERLKNADYEVGGTEQNYLPGGQPVEAAQSAWEERVHRVEHALHLRRDDEDSDKG
jgi:hypothetical protein